MTIIEIHEFSTGIDYVGEPDNWYSREFKGFMNSTFLYEIPIAVQKAIGERLFDVGEGSRLDEPAIIGREVVYEDDAWSVIAIVTSGKDDRERPITCYRYFLTQGLGKLLDILFWYNNIANKPVFNPFDTKEKGQPHSYDTLLTQQYTNSIETLTTDETAPIIIPHSNQCSVVNLHHLAANNINYNELISWAYDVESLLKIGSFKVIYPANADAENCLFKEKIYFRVIPSLCPCPCPPPLSAHPPALLSRNIILLGLLLITVISFIGWLLFQEQFSTIIKIYITAISLCFLPTITHRLTQGKSRLTHSLIESLAFIILLLSYSWWIFGMSVLGWWIIPSIILILVLEIGSNIIELYKISTLQYISQELEFSQIKEKANEIEKLFKNEIAIYFSVPVGLLLGANLGSLYYQSLLEIAKFSFIIVLILAISMLIYFLFVACERMSNSLIKESDISYPELRKETKGWRGLFANFFKIAIPRFNSNKESKDIAIAHIVSNLRKVYLYDSIHNGILLILTGMILTQLLRINLESPKSILLMASSWLLVALIFNFVPYAVGQYLFRTQILKKYSGSERREMSDKIDKVAPLFPINALFSKSYEHTSEPSFVTIKTFLINPTWNNSFKKILYNFSNSHFGGGFAGRDYHGYVTNKHTTNDDQSK